MYADACLKLFDPNGEFFHHRLYRQHCLQPSPGLYVKDLSRLGRDLSKTIIIDNSIHAFGYQLSNGIPIPSFYGQKMDNELPMLVSTSMISIVDVLYRLNIFWLIQTSMTLYKISN